MAYGKVAEYTIKEVVDLIVDEKKKKVAADTIDDFYSAVAEKNVKKQSESLKKLTDTFAEAAQQIGKSIDVSSILNIKDMSASLDALEKAVRSAFADGIKAGINDGIRSGANDAKKTKSHSDNISDSSGEADALRSKIDAANSENKTLQQQLEASKKAEQIERQNAIDARKEFNEQLRSEQEKSSRLQAENDQLRQGSGSGSGGDAAKGPWALEDTLNGVIKNLLTSIRDSLQNGAPVSQGGTQNNNPPQQGVGGRKTNTKEQTTRKLLSLYKQLGEMETRRDVTALTQSEKDVAKDRADYIRLQIKETKNLIKVTSKLKKQLNHEYQAGKIKELKKPLQDVRKQYEIIGKLQARRQSAKTPETSRRIGNTINAKEQYIDSENKRLGLTPDQIKANEALRDAARERAIKEQQNQSTKKQEIKEAQTLIDLYEELGAVQKRLEVAVKPAERYSVEQYADEILAKIDVQERRTLIDTELEGRINDAYKKGQDNEAENILKDLQKQYKEIGNLRAKINYTSDGNLKQQYQSELDAKLELVDVETKRLKLTQNQIDANEKVASSAYYEEEKRQLEAIAKLKDRNAQKDQKEVLRREREVFRSKALSNYADSARKSGDNALMSLLQIDGVDVDALDDVDKLKNAIKSLRDLQNDPNIIRGIINDEDAKKIQAATKEVMKYTVAVQGLIDNYEKYHGENSQSLNTIYDPNQDAERQLENAVRLYTDGRIRVLEYKNETQELIYEVNTGANEWTRYNAGISSTSGELRTVQKETRKTESFMQAFSRKMKDVATYFSGSSIIYTFFNEIKKGIQYVRDVESALTELKKVTDETDESYERFLVTASKTADRVGGTIQEIVSSTADWSRLGFNLKEATALAESTAVLLNVSEFDSVDKATEALTSTIQAFGYVAEDSMGVVDVLNQIGNNFAISSDGIATALQDSASSLVAANNSYQEAVALIAAANRVAQDPSSVGGALRTISLRLRGTSVKELEEAGVDSDGAIESVSKLRKEIKALSGVDILTDTGAYKSTYEILLEISKVFSDINDMDQAECCLYVQKCA